MNLSQYIESQASRATRKSLCIDVGICRQALNRIERTGKAPMEIALLFEQVTGGMINAETLIAGSIERRALAYVRGEK